MGRFPSSAIAARGWWLMVVSKAGTLALNGPGVFGGGMPNLGWRSAAGGLVVSNHDDSAIDLGPSGWGWPFFLISRVTAE